MVAHASASLQRAASALVPTLGGFEIGRDSLAKICRDLNIDPRDL
jgi:hypothetical protein